MSYASELEDEIEALERRRKELMAEETRLHERFLTEEVGPAMGQTERDLDEVMLQLDNIDDKIHERKCWLDEVPSRERDDD